MHLPKNFLILFLLVFISVTRQSAGQIIFNELTNYSIKAEDSVFFDISSTRKIIPLDGHWNVYAAAEKEKKYSVNVPSIFKGAGDLVFERKFSIGKADLIRYKAKLVFFGINYTADISLNNVIIYRHSGGEFPFDVTLPKDILAIDKDNILTVKLNYRLDSENTIPLKQRFLFPKSFGGILRDVYIHLVPNISINDAEIKYTNNSRTTFNISGRIENREFRKAPDSLIHRDQYTFSTFLQPPGSKSYQKTGEFNFTLQKNKDYKINQNFDVAAPLFWSAANPVSYRVRLELRRGDVLLDRTESNVAVYDIKPLRDSILFNGNILKIKGVTFIPSYNQMGSLASYDKMESDIRMIKDAGFNAVRFAKNVPHPYYLSICRTLGLIAFIEIPLNGLPEDLASEPNFLVRSKNYISHYIHAYSKYSSVAALGLGGGYLPTLKEHIQYLKNFGGLVKKETRFITYASFAGLGVDEIPNIDMYGIELFNTPIAGVGFDLSELQARVGTGRVFVSEATYPVNSGNSDGYLNPHSFEAQAKYFEDLLNYSEQNPLSGYFLNSMFDYTGDFASFSCGFTEDNQYTIGLSGFERNTGRLSYKVVAAKQNNTERVTIPIGSKKDDAPMLFIIFGLGLAIILGVLVNSGKKFREDSSRALLRPYNFFADIRDQRLMSGFQSTALLLIIMGISALLLSNLLFYLKMNIIFEKLILSFGSEWLMKSINYLAWNPLMSLVWLMIISGASTIMLVVVIKISALFIHNKVFLSSSFFTVIWSFLPLVLFIPVGIILYRILDADVANLYIYIALAIFTLWIIHRTIKGIYVIYDVNPGSVYFYSFLLIALVAGGLIFYFNYTNSILHYIKFAAKQYNIF